MGRSVSEHAPSVRAMMLSTIWSSPLNHSTTVAVLVVLLLASVLLHSRSKVAPILWRIEVLVVNLHPRRTTPGQTIGSWHDAISKTCCTQPRLYISCDEMQGISSDASALPLRQDCRLPGCNHCRGRRGHSAALMLCQRLELPAQPCRASPRKDVSMCQGLHCATVFRAQYRPKPFRQINLEQLRRKFARALWNNST